MNGYMPRETFEALRVNDKLNTIYDHIVGISECQKCAKDECVIMQLKCRNRFTRLEIGLGLTVLSLLVLSGFNETLSSLAQLLVKGIFK